MLGCRGGCAVFFPWERQLGVTVVSSCSGASHSLRGKALEILQILQILVKQAAREETKSIWEWVGSRLQFYFYLAAGEQMSPILSSSRSILTWCLCK